MGTPITDSLRQKVEAAFQPLHLELENESANHHRGGAETHFKLVIVSNAFDGISRVERQRRVQNLFDAEREQGLHALALWTYTATEWKKIEAERNLTSPKCASEK